MTSKPEQSDRLPTRDEIAQCAYELWQARGESHGSDGDDWLAAEAMLRGAAHDTGSDVVGEQRFEVVLSRIGDDEVRVVRALRDATGLDLKTIKAMTDGAPCTLQSGLSASQAQALRDAVSAAGGTAELRGL